MPRVVRYNNTSNRNASIIPQKEQARAIYANALVTQKTIDLGCTNRVASGPAATTSYSANKITDQRLGAVFTTPVQQAEIIASSPCTVSAEPVIVYPNYELTCSDPAGIQIMASGSFTKFTFTTTSQGAGCIDFQFFLNDSYVSDQFVVLGVDSNLITPPAGIDEVRYVFKCTTIQVNISCANPSNILQYTDPYSFSNITGASVSLTLYKHPIGEGITEIHTVANNQIFTPSPSYGWDYWSIPCANPGSLSFPGTSDNQLYVDASSNLVLGGGDFTIEWYQYYDNDTTNPFPTIFAYGSYIGILDAEVYIDNVNDQIWFYNQNSSEDTLAVSIPDPYRDTWCHFAICRSSGVLYIYQNGYLLDSCPSTYNYADDTLPLTIGNEESTTVETSFQGKITGFRLTIGQALYPGGIEFTPPVVPLKYGSSTQLLLDVTTEATFLVDSSPANRTVYNTGVIYSTSNPLP